MDSYSVVGILSAVDKNYTSTMREAEKSLDNMESSSEKSRKSLLKIGGAAVVFKAVDMATDALTQSLDGAIRRYDTLNNFPKIMSQIGFSTEDSTKSINKLSDGIDGLPTSLDGITASTKTIAILTRDLEGATDTSLALNNAFLASGSATADAERGLTQYVQMLGKGKVDMQSWRTLQETMGPALYDVAQGFGIASGSSQELYDKMQSGEITFDQFNAKIIELNEGVNGFAERARTASGGIGTALANIQTAFVRGTTIIIEATDKMLEDNGFPKLEDMINNAKGGIISGAKMIGEGIQLTGAAVKELAPYLKIGASAWIAYEAAMTISGTVTDVRKKIADVSKAIDTVKSATELSTKATEVASKVTLIAAQAKGKQEKADRLAEVALKLEARAKTASKEVSEAKTIANKLEREAQSAATKAAQANTAAEKLNARAANTSEKAVKTRTKAVEANWKAAELNAAAETKAVAASQAKAKADALGATATQRSAKAKAVSTKASMANAGAEAASTAATSASTAAETANAAAVAANNAQLTIKQIAIGVLTGQIGVIIGVQMAWNRVMEQNPIGAMIALAAGLTAGAIALAKAFGNGEEMLAKYKDGVKKVSEASKELIEDIDNSQEAHKKNITSLEANAAANQDLAKKIADLSQKESKSAEDKALLQSYVGALNSSMEELGLQYDAENDALNMSTDAIYSKIDAYKAQAKAQAAQEQYVELLKSQMEIEDKLNSVSKEREELQKNELDLVNAGMVEVKAYNDSKAELIETEQALKDKKAEVSESILYYDGILAESAQNAAEAANTGMESQIITMEDLDETQTEIVNSMNEKWQEYADHATNMFDVLSDKQELSFDEMMANMEENQRVMSQWADNLAILADRGVNKGVLEQLRNMGPAGAGYVATLAQGTSDEMGIGLERLNSITETGLSTATDTMKTAFQMSDVPQYAMDMMTRTKTSMVDGIKAADFASVGKNVVDGYSDGISNNAQSAEDAGKEMATDTQDAVKSADDSHSPSRKYKQFGGYVVMGYAEGIESRTSLAIQAAERMAKNAAQAADKLKGEFRTAGQNASYGLADGIYDGAQSAISAANWLADQIAATMRSALDINSPSRVTRKIGEFAGEGAGLGILDMVGYTKAASQRLAEAMVPGSTANSFMATRNYSSKNHKFRNDYTYHPTVYVQAEVTSVMDGREVGYGSAEYVEEKNQRVAKLRKQMKGIR